MALCDQVGVNYYPYLVYYPPSSDAAPKDSYLYPGSAPRTVNAFHWYTSDEHYETFGDAE